MDVAAYLQHSGWCIPLSEGCLKNMSVILYCKSPICIFVMQIENF